MIIYLDSNANTVQCYVYIDSRNSLITIIQRGTTTLVTFFDASKAFDKIDFNLLCQKHFIKMFLYLLFNSYLLVLSSSNGVKQGGISSPMLFNVYMDLLSISMIVSGIRGDIGNHVSNHFCYADDLCLISLSSTVMQSLLHICNSYASEHALTDISSKSYYIYFKPKHTTFDRPCFLFKSLEIPRDG